MIVAIVLAAGFLVGVLVGRWWILAAPVALGLWFAATSEVEVASWWLGVAYGGTAALGVVAGVLVRRRVGRQRGSPT